MDDRIVRAKIEAVRRRAVLQSDPIGGWQARTAEHIGPSAYRFDGDWTAVSAPESWPAGRTLFLRTRARLPAAAEGEMAYLCFDCQFLEGMLSIDGKPFAGIDQEHPRVAITLSGSHDLAAEFMCVPDSFSHADARRERALLRGVRWDAVRGKTEAFAWDAQFAWEAARCVPDARRRALINSAVEKALLAVDLTAVEQDFRSAIAAARELLRGLLACIGADPEEGRVFLTGHSHIDTAWLWPLRETIRKCGRTFSTACRLMERYPDYRFSCSQPRLYAYTKEHFPSLFEEIRRWVSAGRWECTGGMWVEADCNVPSGESLIRQFLHGISFFRREFGKRPTTCWLPDVFGYPASLPGILAGCGITSFFTTKLHWQARNPFPAHLFQWEGIDGSRVTAHVPLLKENYNGSPTPEHLRTAWEGFNEKAAYHEVMLPFGFGDGGGGPTQNMLELADRARAFPGLPSCRQGLVEEYFEDIRKRGPELPSWEGELYLETHRGTYTTQSAIKRANRKNELALRDAEMLASIVEIEEEGAASVAAAPGGRGAAPGDRGAAPGAPSPGSKPDGAGDRLRDAWQKLLLLQFHDILPGSSIGQVYKEALGMHAEIEAAAHAVSDDALSRLTPASTAKPRRASAEEAVIIAFNTLSWDRQDPVEADIPDLGDSVEAVQPDGSTVPAQVISRTTGSARVVFVPRSLPSIGFARFIIRKAAPASTPFRADGNRIESPLSLIELDGDGSITRLFDKKNGREVVAEGLSANRLRLYQDGPEGESAWNIHPVFENREYPWDPGTSARVIEQGPVRLVVRITRRYRRNLIEQDMVVWAEHERIDFVTRAEWSERQALLKACFPVAVRSDRAAYEIQFGAVYRPTHRNTSWEQEKFEVCAHRWMDLSEPGYGVSLLNDSRYGCDIRGQVMRLTLLRGAEWPDPDADKGKHEFVYSLFPHAGDWTAAGTARRAWELNAPAICRPGSSLPENAPAAQTFFTAAGPGILQTLKRAEDGEGWILRFYEPHGGRGTVTVTARWPIASVAACNHIEEGSVPHAFEGNAFSFPLLPFQVRTFKITF